MSVTKLNKITGLEPQEETLEEFHGPANSLKETVRVTENIKLALREVEHYIQHYTPRNEGSAKGLKQRLQTQLIKTKQETVQLAQLLEKELEDTTWIFDDDDKVGRKPK